MLTLGVSAITPIISNTAVIQMIHHGRAAQVKPVIYHRVDRRFLRVSEDAEEESE